MKIRLAQNLQQGSIVDGEGLRAVIWSQGCSHNCEGCHNPQTHDFCGGFLIDVDEVKNQLSRLEAHQGVTFSGGDPMFQIDAFLEIAQHCKTLGLDLWCYTGFTFETLRDKSQKSQNLEKLLRLIDVLVDGKFMIKERSLNLYFRGSKNQRIIDVQKSLNTGTICLVYRYMQEKHVQNYSSDMHQEVGIFI